MKCNAVPPGKSRTGFTLIEVVLAVGIFVFAIVSIFGLFGSSLQSNKQVTDEDEALGIARALPAYLQTQGFKTVYGWIQSPTSAPPVYAYYVLPGIVRTTGSYTGTAQEAFIVTGTDAAFTSGNNSYVHRQGRLFSIQMSLSPNMPIHTGTNSNTVFPLPNSSSVLSNFSSSGDDYPESILPIRASIYAISATNAALGAFPVFSYDTAVSR